MKVEKYYPQKNYLKGIIKYFWVIRSNKEESLFYKLLPVNNIDIVLNFGAPMYYVSGEKMEAGPKYSFTGIRNQYHMVNQVGKLNLFGVSFFSANFYPFLKVPLSEYSNKTVDLSIFIKTFNSEVEKKFNPEGIISQQIDILEDIFIHLMKPISTQEKRIITLINTFYKSIDAQTIKEFSDNYGINQRKLERIFRKYIGISPKTFQRIYRFQIALSRLLKPNLDNFTTIAHENRYYDQAHFNHDFRQFAGCSPSKFLSEKRSMKQMLVD